MIHLVRKKYLSSALGFAPLVLGSLLITSSVLAVDDPILTPGAADSAVGFDLTISCPTAGATIRYTLNGLDPVVGDPIIPSGGSVRIARSSIVKAKAWFGTQTSDITEEDYRITGAVSAGEQHALAMSMTGDVWAWGRQYSGRLGNGLQTNVNVPVPGRVKGVGGIGDFDSGLLIATGYYHSLILDESGEVLTFGYNINGQLGNGTTVNGVTPAAALTAPGVVLDDCIGIAGGYMTSYALKQDGSVWSWGLNSYGGVGNGLLSGTQLYAGQVQRGDDPLYPNLTGIIEIARNGAGGMAREPYAGEDPQGLGRVWVWGSGIYGRLAQGSTAHQPRALPMLLSAGVELTDVTNMSAGTQHTAVVRWKDGDPNLQGSVWCAGNAQYGRLGHGVTSGSVTYPVQVLKASDNLPLQGIVQVAGGSAHTLALDDQGRVWSWGYNGYGALGVGNTAHSSKAIQVKNADGTAFLENIVAIEAGGNGIQGSSMAIADDGTIWVWGRNHKGQLGTGVINTWSGVKLPTEHVDNHIDEGSPSVTLSTTMVSSMEMGEVSVTATPSHSGPSGVSAIDRVEIYLNGTVVSTLYGSPWTTNLDDLVEGDYRVVAVARDTAGVISMSDPDTFSITLNPLFDADGDGLTNGDEQNIHNTDPKDPDSDGDGMEDGYEEWHGFDPNSEEIGTSNSPTADADSDGVSNLDEHDAGRMCNLSSEYFSALEFLSGTVSWFARDGFWYTIEVSEDLSNWELYPMGFIGINQEVSVDWLTWWGYLPSSAFIRLRYGPADSFDVDGDGLSPELEFQLGLDPTKVDTDGDGTDDGLEDSDGDGYSNLEELVNGWDPAVADGDSDGLSDFDEISWGISLYNTTDSDGDGLSDATEIALGLNPMLADSDFDGIEDPFDVLGLNPGAIPPPDATPTTGPTISIITPTVTPLP